MLNKELLLINSSPSEVLVEFRNYTTYSLVISIGGAFESFSIGPDSMESFPVPIGTSFAYSFPAWDGESPTPEYMDSSNNIKPSSVMYGLVVTEYAENSYVEFSEIWG